MHDFFVKYTPFSGFYFPKRLYYCFRPTNAAVAFALTKAKN
ncbi:hypothetical protein ADIS_1320 [Lunatimonas lonarensis]|uniref:Uncharacterized protein n=1 Tax=Lunatimonas lonarensis TaxID=1232681 RepID=R7ZVT5_9BACT|nr:hypothetical protein ADIS_1320 [Lunatimonas lonarensis]